MKSTAFVLRFISNMKSRVQKRHDEMKVEELEPSELEQVEKLWKKALQIHVQEDQNFKQLEHRFGLFKDPEEMWICQGRIEHSSLKYEAKFPALLSSNHHLTSLIIKTHTREFYTMD